MQTVGRALMPGAAHRSPAAEFLARKRERELQALREQGKATPAAEAPASAHAERDRLRQEYQDTLRKLRQFICGDP